MTRRNKRVSAPLHLTCIYRDSYNERGGKLEGLEARRGQELVKGLKGVKCSQTATSRVQRERRAGGEQLALCLALNVEGTEVRCYRRCQPEGASKQTYIGPPGTTQLN